MTIKVQILRTKLNVWLKRQKKVRTCLIINPELIILIPGLDAVHDRIFRMSNQGQGSGAESRIFRDPRLIVLLFKHWLIMSHDFNLYRNFCRQSWNTFKGGRDMEKSYKKLMGLYIHFFEINLERHLKYLQPSSFP